MKVNFHTHTSLCKHARGSACDYTKIAFDNGYDMLGISDHAPFSDFDYGYRMFYSELDKYCNEVNTEKEKYKDKMKVFSGLEIEFLPEYIRGSNYYETLLKDKLDYLICGEHFFRDQQGWLHNITSIERPELIIDYAKACVEAMKTGYFKALCHPDLFGINDFPWTDIQDRATDILIEGSLKTGVVLELNANGFRRGIVKFSDGNRVQYPLNQFWDKVKQAGLPAVVGVDAHEPEHLIDDYNTTAYNFLAERGIKAVDDLNI